MLGLPRSSVSTGIAKLEAHLGARLLHRTTRKVSPTPEGVAFYERCLRILAEVEDAETLFHHTSSSLSGKVRVDVPGRVGRLIILPALPTFLAAQPHIDIMLGMTDRAVNLIEENIDCVLRTGALPNSELAARLIGELPLINVASPAYLAQNGTPKQLVDLPNHWAVGYASPTTGRLETWEVTQGQHTRQLCLPARVTVNNAEAYIAAAIAGLGMIQIPAYDIAQQLASGELVEILPTERAAPMQMTLLYPHRRHVPPRVRAFTDWLEALLKQTTQTNERLT